MTTDNVIEALLAGEEISSEDVKERFGMHPTGMGQVVLRLKKDGYHVNKRKDGKVTFYKLTDQPEPQKIHQPLVGDTLQVRNIGLNEKEEVEITAHGLDGVYLIQVVAFKASKK